MKRRKHSYAFRVINIGVALTALKMLMEISLETDPLAVLVFGVLIGMNIDWFMEDYF